jgi:Xaa-Pro aminopeptidase
MVVTVGKVTKKRYTLAMILKYDFAPHQFDPGNLVLSQNLEFLDTNFADFDAIVLNPKDPFISEYVPLINNQRYGVTGFTGSTGDAIYWTKAFRKLHPEQKAVTLFVDGRYHLQADRETDPKVVEVVKLDVEPNIESGVRDRLSKLNSLKIGIDFERTSVAALDRYLEMAAKSKSKLVHVPGEKVLNALGLKGWKIERPIFSLPESSTGRTIMKNLRALTQDLRDTTGSSDVLHVTAATDDAAFLLNARGYHLPNTASFLAYTFFAQNELIVFLPSSSKACPVEIDETQLGEFRLTVIRDDAQALKAALKEHAVKHVLFNGGTMNGLLPSMLKELFPEAKQNSAYQWVMKTRTRKTPQEMTSIRSSFIRSSHAIAKTLRWGKDESQKRNLSEVDLANYLYESYGSEGAVALSFKTISGAGGNSAVVHYSTPSEKEYFSKGKLALLDSGAYYSEGFCTDCTRGFFAGSAAKGDQPEAWQKDIYTTTLKSAIQVFLKPVDGKLSGKEVDTLIRGKVKDAGYDYMHGTGHGIGIHVHEEGIRLSTLSTYPQSPYACVSVEPGIYLQDKGGVRVENVALLHPDGPNYRYENVVYVGYDWDLIDLTKLTTEEKAYLKDYESKCAELGTTLTACPL